MSLRYTWLPAGLPDISSPLKVVKASGSHLVTAEGAFVYDAISSWWCKPLGHRHELVKHSIDEQLAYFEHHIPANAYNDIIEELSSALVKLCPGADKVVYASDGSSAVEIAMKLSYETRCISGQAQRSKFLALSGAYHGETIFTLSVCGIKHYTRGYARLLQGNFFINEIVYVSSREDPKWLKCEFDEKALEQFIATIVAETTALIIEPVVQGAGGMKIISRDFLKRLILIARKYGLHIISDEIMVGLGRLGCYCVSAEMLGIIPDLVCMSKNLTAGAIPMSAVVVNTTLTDIFRNHKRLFAHSHTHSCNALAARVALNYLKFLGSSSLLQSVHRCESKLLNLMHSLALGFSWVVNPRAIGAIAACELNLDQKIINQLFQIGLQHDIYLRPISNTLYVMPPLYNIEHDLHEIRVKLYRVLDQLNQSIASTV